MDTGLKSVITSMVKRMSLKQLRIILEEMDGNPEFINIATEIMARHVNDRSPETYKKIFGATWEQDHAPKHEDQANEE